MITLSDAIWATTAFEFMEANCLVSLMSPQHMIPTPSAISPRNHLKLEMHDVEAFREGYIVPNRAHVNALLSFGDLRLK